jgi:hypothetical protein
MLIDLDGDDVLEFVGSTAFYSSGDVIVRRGGPTGRVLFTLTHPAASVGFGHEVRPLRDLDGDGTRDLAVIASSDTVVIAGQRVEHVGRVFAFSGADGRSLGVFEPPVATQVFGAAVVVLPDVDGDGAADVAIGSHGMAFVFSGATRTALHRLGPSDLYAAHGTALADLGDVDGDGWHDVAVGAPGPVAVNGIAHVRVFSARSGALLWQVQGSGPERFGAALASCGDFDGDEIGDLAIGVPQRMQWSTLSTAPGQVRIVSGTDGRTLGTVRGEVAGEGFGTFVDSLGDVDGDHRSDLVVGAGYVVRPPVYVVSGAPRPLAADSHLAPLATAVRQRLEIDAGAAHGGNAYFVLGSASGIAPGFEHAGVHVPLNPDFWSLFTLSAPNTAVLAGTFGVLDARGRGGATITLPALHAPELAGLTLAHAAVLLEETTPVLATNPVQLTFVR